MCSTDIMRDNTPKNHVTELASPPTLDTEYFASNEKLFFHEKQTGTCYVAVANAKFKYHHNPHVSVEERKQIDSLVNKLHPSYA